MRQKLPHQIYRTQFLGLLIFGVFILLSQIGFSYYNKNQINTIPTIEFETENSETTPLLLTEFNPNDLDEKQWRNLGFSEKQIATIMKYKNVVGGNFKSKEQLKKCFAISPKKFAELNSYLLLPETSKDYKSVNYDFKKFEKKEIKISGKFNPDNFSIQNWQNMGFSENQANAILKYKNFLGGSFVSKEKFKECFIINDENYKKIAPFLLLPEKTPENFRKNYTSSFAKEKPKIIYHNFDPNLMDFEGWKSLGFTEKQAQVIVNYRDINLRGNFKSIEDVQKCFVISAEKFEELKSFVKLNPENFAIKNTQNLSQNQGNLSKNNSSSKEITKTDFSKVDLNKIMFNQLSEFGFDEKQSAGFLSFRKKLGGFSSTNQIYDVYYADKILLQKLISTTFLNPVNLEKFDLVTVNEDILKTNPYFSYHANKIIYYRVTYPDAKKILKFLKLKPLEEAKMKLYIK